MNTQLVNTWTEKTRATTTSDQVMKSRNESIAQVEVKGDLDNDAATRLDESAKDAFLAVPPAVIPEHINEAATSGDQPTGERLRLLLQLVDRKTAVEIPLSGVVMEFDGRGHRIK